MGRESWNCAGRFLGIERSLGASDAGSGGDVRAGGGTRGSSTVVVISSSSSISSSVTTVICGFGVGGLLFPIGIPRCDGETGPEWTFGVKNTALGVPITLPSVFLIVKGFVELRFSCADFAVSSLNNHPVMVFPRCAATLETWTASPLAFPLFMKYGLCRETLGVGGTGLTCSISIVEQEVGIKANALATQPPSDVGRKLPLYSCCVKILFLYRNHGLPTLPHLCFRPGPCSDKENENVSGKWEMGFVYWRK
jgi:hypothetical protein